MDYELNDYCAILYKNDGIIETEIDNYKSVYAVKDIDKGEILVIEHVYCNDFKICVDVIRNNKYLYDLCYPRTDSFDTSSPQTRYNNAITKLNHNCFGRNGKMVLAAFIQLINHSCTPNAHVNVDKEFVFQGTSTIFFVLYAVKQIKSGDQITISYGPKTSHERDFECGCGFDLQKRNKIYDIMSKYANCISYEKKDEKYKIMKDYLTNPISKKILLNQYLATNGIFISDNKLFAYDKNGEDIINRYIKKYMNLTEDSNMNHLYDDKISLLKINLFTSIVNITLLENLPDNYHYDICDSENDVHKSVTEEPVTDDPKSVIEEPESVTDPKSVTKEPVTDEPNSVIEEPEPVTDPKPKN